MLCSFNVGPNLLNLAPVRKLKISLKPLHTGYAYATVSEVVDCGICGAEDFAEMAVMIDVVSVRLDYPEHSAPP